MRQGMVVGAVASLVVPLVALSVAPPAFGGSAAKDRLEGPPWPAKVEGHVPVQPGEHPRLLFRKKDLAEIKRRAETPEGKMIIARLGYLLDGEDGGTMTTAFNPATSEYPGGAEAKGAEEASKKPGVFTHSHAAGYGFLYQLTGDRRYAEFGRQCMIKGMDEKVRDRDSRYSLYNTGALRAGPALACYALGYDLCYEGWDPGFRKHVCDVLLNLNSDNKGSHIFIDNLAQGKRHHPACNHWGGQISGPPMLALAMMNDPEADQGRVKQILEWGEKSTLRQLTEGIGDWGFFGGGFGPGVITTDTGFTTLLRAWRVAGGKDFTTPRPVGEWLALMWVMDCVPTAKGGKPVGPLRGVYGNNYFARTGMSGSGTFCQGFGILSDRYKPALLWLYNRTFQKEDLAAKLPWDSVNAYPHRSIMALVNWPVGMKEDNPGKVLPKAYLDKYWNLASFRNRWQDENDIVVNALLEQSGGHYRCPPDTRVIHGGRVTVTPVCLRGKAQEIRMMPNGASIKSDKGSFGVDFGGTSGAEALLVWAGAESGGKKPDLSQVAKASAGGTELSLMAFGGTISPSAKGNAVAVGTQSITVENGMIVFAK